MPGVTNTGTGLFNFQAGGGSAAYGGGLQLYCGAHATKPGWVTVGLASGGGNKFAVNTQGAGGGSDIFSVDYSGNVIVGRNSSGSNKTITMYPSTSLSGTLVIKSDNNAGNYANTLVNGATTAARTWTLPDASGTLSLTESAAGGSTTQIQYNNAGALAGDTGFTTDGAGTETIVGQLNVDNLRLDGNSLISFTDPLQLVSSINDRMSMIVSGTESNGVQLSHTNAAGRPSFLFNRDTTTLIGGIYAGYASSFGASGDEMFIYNPLSHAVNIRIGTTTAATFDASSLVLSGSITAPSGINFGQDTLNYYDEGTFTPVLRFGSGSTGITYAQQAGFYIRTGSTVWFKVVIVLTSKGSDTGAASFTGLPFTASNDNISGLNSFYPYLNLVTFTANPLAYILDNTSTLSLSRLVSAGTNTNLTDAAFVNTSRVIIVGTYDV